MKLSGTHLLLIYYDDDASVLGGNVHAIKKNTEASVVARREIRQEVNAVKNKGLVMSIVKNSGRTYSL